MFTLQSNSLMCLKLLLDIPFKLNVLGVYSSSLLNSEIV